MLSFWGGLLGLVFTAIWIFWEKAPMKRVFLTFFVLIFFLSLILVWLDEYRDHKKDQKLYQTAHQAWETQKKDLEDKLENERGKSPMVVYRSNPLATPSKRDIRESLTSFIQEGRRLIKVVTDAGPENVPTKQGNVWYDKVTHYLKTHLDSSYVFRFQGGLFKDFDPMAYQSRYNQGKAKALGNFPVPAADAAYTVRADRNLTRVYQGIERLIGFMFFAFLLFWFSRNANFIRITSNKTS